MYGPAARTTEIIYQYIILVGKFKGKRPLGKPMSIQEDNVQMYVKEIVY
jgi:hypothetical protein